MDLLGSILGNMQKPPSSAMSKEKQLAKKEEERLKKIHEQAKVTLKKFRAKIETQVDQFLDDDDKLELAFDPMEKSLRAVIHDVVDIAGLVAFTFGIEDIDRHIVVYKKDSIPCEDELNCLKKGEVYDPDKIRLEKEMREEDEKDMFKKKAKLVPKTNFNDKYEHLIGKESGKSAAQITTTNKQFGLVPSANKRDQRSIEQTLADMKNKKKKRDEEDV
ncbi:Sperm-associated antigen 7 [Halotydeus destructor]|nr:Sperm-associated antigen 7 [Halotydeus destructor]